MVRNKAVDGKSKDSGAEVASQYDLKSHLCHAIIEMKDMPREQMADIFGPVNLVIPRCGCLLPFVFFLRHRTEHIDLPVLFKYLDQDIYR